ncbi:hypothetical protein [Streptomyces cellulosae]|uniref:hypothetical protein n=1 Tax=Streptomyces cellulosae TaxID=1968 RepID=UPI0004C6FDBA|nr:hypothetical protein [Streptomyces cellulosae]
MLQLLCTIAVAALALCVISLVRAALRRRGPDLDRQSGPADPEQRVLMLLGSGQRIAAVRQAATLTDGDMAAALAYVERLEAGSGR